MISLGLPRRSGPKPRTTPTNPHTQLDQNPGPEIVEELTRRIFSFPDVTERPECHLRAWSPSSVAPG